MKYFKLEVFYNVLAQTIQLLFPLIILVLASRSLSPESFLDIASVTYWMALQTVVVGFGFEQVITRDIAAGEDNLKFKVFSLVIFCQLVIWFFLLIGSLIYNSISGIFFNANMYALIGSLGYALAPPWLIMAIGLNKQILFFGFVVRSAVLLVLFFISPSILVYSLLLVSVSSIIAIRFLIVARNHGFVLNAIKLREVVDIVVPRSKPVAITFLSKLSVAGYTTIIPLAVTNLANPLAAQLYVASDKIKNILQYGVGAVLPVFNRFYLDPKHKSEKLVHYYWFGLGAVVIGVIFLSQLNELILPLIGIPYEGSKFVFTILIISIIPIYLTNYFGLLKIFYEGNKILFLIPLLLFGLLSVIFHIAILETFGISGVALLVFLTEMAICLYYISVYFWNNRV